MARRLHHLILMSPPTGFMTLTCNVKRHPDPRRAYIAMNRAFPLLIKRLRRDHPGQSFEYLAVWEATKAGYPHLHVLLRAPFLPQRVVSGAWRDLFGSPIVDVRAVQSSRQAVLYVAKYLTKALDAPPGIRRWRASAGFFQEPFRPRVEHDSAAGTVSLHRGTVRDLVFSWFAAGWFVRPLDDGTATAVDLGHLDYAHATAWSAYRVGLAQQALALVPT